MKEHTPRERQRRPKVAFRKSIDYARSSSHMTFGWTSSEGISRRGAEAGANSALVAFPTAPRHPLLSTLRTYRHRSCRSIPRRRRRPTRRRGLCRLGHLVLRRTACFRRTLPRGTGLPRTRDRTLRLDQTRFPRSNPRSPRSSDQLRTARASRSHPPPPYPPPPPPPPGSPHPSGRATGKVGKAARRASNPRAWARTGRSRRAYASAPPRRAYPPPPPPPPGAPRRSTRAWTPRHEGRRPIPERRLCGVRRISARLGDCSPRRLS